MAKHLVYVNHDEGSQKMKPRPIEEIKADIDNLDKEIFYHEMKDHWDNSDFEWSHEQNDKLKELQKELEDAENAN